MTRTQAASNGQILVRGGTPRSEVDALAGHVILNSFRSEAALAKALSVRTKISPHIAASLTYTVATDMPLDWHSGAAVQLWAEAPLTRAFYAGAGAGVFFTAVRANPPIRTCQQLESRRNPRDHGGLRDQHPLGRPRDLESSHDPRR